MKIYPTISELKTDNEIGNTLAPQTAIVEILALVNKRQVQITSVHTFCIWLKSVGKDSISEDWDKDQR